MNTLDRCPPLDELRRLLENLPESAEANAILLHLEACETCTQALRTLERSDRRFDALRSAADGDATDDPGDAALIERLMDLLRRCGPDGSGDLSVPTLDTPAAGNSRSDTTAAFVPNADDADARPDFLSPPAAAGEIGRLGEFRLLRRLGAGGMGIVYEAEDPHLRRRVAVKVLQPATARNARARQQFLIEARAVAAIEHERIVVVHQVGEHDGLPFLAMQLLKGESLAERLARTPVLPVAEALRIALEVAEGLAAAHARGLIHRDIKPANIWLDAAGDHVKLLDFGLALGLADEPDPNEPGTLAGTPAYMSPEQAKAGPLDARTDLFSLGGVLYRMLTGRQPFEGRTMPAMLAAVCGETPAPIGPLRPEVPVAVIRFTDRLLEKDRTRRPASADEAVAEIASLAAGLRGGRHGGRGRRMITVFAASAAFVMLFGGLWVVVRDRNGKETARVQLPPGGSVLVAEPNAKGLDGPPAAVGRADRFESPEYFAAQRRVAEWAIGIGAKAATNGGGLREARTTLPNGTFRVTALDFYGVRAGEFDPARLDEVPELIALNLPTAPSADTMERIGRLSELVHLELTDARLTDAELLPLVRLKKLGTLKLSNCGRLTDGAFEHLAKLTSLRELSLRDAPGIRGTEVRRLKAVEGLMSLTLATSELDDAGLGETASLPSLIVLNVEGRFTDAGLDLLAESSRATMVFLGSPNVTDAGLIRFIRHPRKLSGIGVSRTPATDAFADALRAQRDLMLIHLPKNISLEAFRRLQVAHPGKMVDVERRQLLGAGGGDTAYFAGQRRFAEWMLEIGARGGLGGVAGMPTTSWVSLGPKLPTGTFRIWVLDFLGTAVTDGDLVRLDEVPELRSLFLPIVPSRASMERIGRLPELSRLHLTGGVDGNDDIRALLGPNKLSVLLIQRSGGLTDGVFEHCAAMPLLEELSFTSCPEIRVLNLGPPAAWKRLKSLTFSQMNLDDAALRNIAALPNLESVTVSGSFTDAGLDALATLPRLRKIHLTSPKLTEAGLLRLLARAPGLTSVSALGLDSVSDAVIDALVARKVLLLVDFGPKLPPAAEKRLLVAHPNLKRSVANTTLADPYGHLLPDGVAPRDLQGDGPLPPGTESYVANHRARSAQRRFAEWVLSRGGKVALDSSRTIAQTTLPSTGDLRVTGADLRNAKLVSADLERFADAPNLERLILEMSYTRDDLVRIGGMANLRNLVLVGDATTDDLLEPLSKLPRLESLAVHGSKRLTDAVFGRLAPLETLRELHLTDCPGIRGAGLERLKGMKKLACLNLFGADADDDALRRVGTLTGLTELGLSGTFTDLGLDALHPLQRMDQCRLSSPRVTDAGLSRLVRAWPALQGIDLTGCGATDGIVDALGRAKSLRWITLDPARVSVAAFRRLGAAHPGLTLDVDRRRLHPPSAPLPPRETPDEYAEQRRFAQWAHRLGARIVVTVGVTSGLEFGDNLRVPPTAPFRVTRAEFRGKTVTDADLVRLDGLPQLEALTLDIPLSRAGYERLARLPTLRELRLEGSEPTLDDLRKLMNVRTLEKIHLVGARQLTDEVFDLLARMPKLQSLILVSGPLRGHGIGRLKSLPALSNLALEYCEIDDAGLEEISALTSLRGLQLAGPFTDRGLAQLKRLPELTSLSIGSRQVTDKGILECLAQLPKLERLSIVNASATDAFLDGLAKRSVPKSIQLTPASFTPAALERLHAARPELILRGQDGKQLEFGKPMPKP